MKQFFSWISFMLLTLVMLIGCHHSESADRPDEPERRSIAFMPDVHFHDVFAVFYDSGFDGLPTLFEGEERPAAIRTMEAQLTSTRLFNENYFAFIAALDDAVERGIRLIGLPGDFSDDGQPAHLNGLVNILNHYRDEHNLQFFIAPGNHDPNRPFSRAAGKMDYLGENGRAQPVFSINHPFCTNPSDHFNSNTNQSGLQLHDVICTDEVKELGYEEILGLLGEHGLYPNENYFYYETPFSSYEQNGYSYNQAFEEAQYSNRLYEICHEGSGGIYREPHFTNCFDVMDMSYLVEPIENLWLLSIDANVYIPVEDANTNFPSDPANFSGSGNSGYNSVLTHKQHLLDWIEDVAKRAEVNDKTLIAFSHFPAIDFYNRAREKIEGLWGEGRFQVRRIPFEETSRVLAESGLNLHIGGHMHMNDTGITDHNHVNNTSSVQDIVTGNRLFNIQVPSLAAYIPAYKVLYLQDDKDIIEVETVILKEVPNFDTLFSHYLVEWHYLESINYENNWNRDILHSSGYYEFTDWHIRELSRLRFLPQEWPEDIRIMLKVLDGSEMFIAANLNQSIPFAEFKDWVDRGETELQSMSSEFSEAWGVAERKAEIIAHNAGYSLSDFQNWTGMDLSIDFYRLRNADELAFRDIPEERFKHYSILAATLAEAEFHPNGDDHDQVDFDEVFKGRFKSIFEVMRLFSEGLPSDNFILNLKDGTIDNLSENRPGNLLKK